MKRRKELGEAVGKESNKTKEAEKLVKQRGLRRMKRRKRNNVKVEEAQEAKASEAEEARRSEAETKGGRDKEGQTISRSCKSIFGR